MHHKAESQSKNKQFVYDKPEGTLAEQLEAEIVIVVVDSNARLQWSMEGDDSIGTHVFGKRVQATEQHEKHRILLLKQNTMLAVAAPHELYTADTYFHIKPESQFIHYEPQLVIVYRHTPRTVLHS